MPRCVLLTVLARNLLTIKGYSMIGIIVELIISGLLLWLIDKKGLSVLGFKPTPGRITNLGVGLLLAAFSCITYHLMFSAFANNSWVLNKQLNQQTILTGAWWTLKSVLFEELIFRGALLYIAIESLVLKPHVFFLPFVSASTIGSLITYSEVPCKWLSSFS